VLTEGGTAVRICYYGDDFTGSTDVLEALTLGGLKMILFMELPDPVEWKEQFADYDGFGVAGVSRTMSPDDMERDLKPALQRLRSFGAPITHYKVCSTFDSAPLTGSIGKVLDIGRDVFTSQRYIPILAGCPRLKRFTVFGNHFTALGDETIRLDRHPNMSRHPITPMKEADLRLHLAEQTNQSIGLMNVLDLEQTGAGLEERYQEHISRSPGALLFDVLSEDHLATIGGLLAEESERQPIFAVGSSGVEYSLVAHWQRSGQLPEKPPCRRAAEADRLLVVSGSCSPVTANQIKWAMEHGYEGIHVPAEAFFDGGAAVTVSVLQKAERMLLAGKSVILYTALGPEDESIAQTQQRLIAEGKNHASSGQLIGEHLGDMAKHLMAAAGLSRLVIAGGDTSGFATSRLGVYALEMLAPTVPGGPICRAFSREAQVDGLDIVLKGGQVGPQHFFELVRKGGV
jgi:3-oxoisoapionate kinase